MKELYLKAQPLCRWWVFVTVFYYVSWCERNINWVILHVLAIKNSAAMNIGVHVSLSILDSSVCMPSRGMAGSSVQFRHSVVSNSLQPHESQHARPPCPSPNPGVNSDSSLSSQWCYTASHPLLSPSPPAPNPPHNQSLFQWVNSLHEVAKGLEFQPQHQYFQWTPRTGLLWDGLVGSPCSPRNSQESSPTPQLKSINSLVLSFLYSPILTSICDYWKNHNVD